MKEKKLKRKTEKEIRDYTNKLLGIAASMQLSANITQAQIQKYRQFLHISQQSHKGKMKCGKIKYPTIQV